MPVLEYDGKQVAVDEAGFLVNFAEWNEDVAHTIAKREGIGVLQEDRLDILRFMRDYYKRHNFFPIIRYVCKNVHQPKNCINEKFIDPVQAWKIAGLPNPGDEVMMFRSWEPLGT
jgi:TusE/DsrC/DsvC family sulfur relay protein